MKRNAVHFQTQLLVNRKSSDPISMEIGHEIFFYQLVGFLFWIFEMKKSQSLLMQFVRQR